MKRALKTVLLGLVFGVTFLNPVKAPVVTCAIHNHPAIYIGKSRVESDGSVYRLYYHDGHTFWVESTE